MDFKLVGSKQLESVYTMFDRKFLQYLTYHWDFVFLELMAILPCLEMLGLLPDNVTVEYIEDCIYSI